MKKLFLFMFLLGTMLHAGFFSTAQGVLMDSEKADTEYTLDTNGINPRVYEFTPKANENMTCLYIVISGKNEVATNLQCFIKKG